MSRLLGMLFMLAGSFMVVSFVFVSSSSFDWKQWLVGIVAGPAAACYGYMLFSRRRGW